VSVTQLYPQLVAELRSQADLAGALHLLQWDQETYMPAGVAETRARQIGALSAALHQRRTEPAFLGLVDELASSSQLDVAQNIDVRETKWRIDRQRALDTELIRERSQLHAESRARWIEARAADDFGALRPYLERIVEIERQVAGCIDSSREPYEVLLEGYEPGMTVAAIEGLFTELRTRLQPLAGALPAAGKGLDRTTALQGDFPLDRQREFNRGVAAAIGFDFDKGRLDVAAHPFTMSIGDDVRLTTRYDETDLRYSLYSTIHEAGHGLYEQGLDREAWGLPRGFACSLGVHESQSRFWENIVGRSRGFWEHFLPRARAHFPCLREASLGDVIRSANEARRSLIRTEADEITYNLHIILRFELERALIAGTLKVGELPQAWREAMQISLGVVPPDDRDGVLQDVHWASGAIGYFPTYTLGNIYAAELAAAAERALGSLQELMAKGEFGELLSWLRRGIHRLGQTHRGLELVATAIGHPPEARALVDHLIRKSRVVEES
jgi:carboxypeptidase Taq